MNPQKIVEAAKKLGYSGIGPLINDGNKTQQEQEWDISVANGIQRKVDRTPRHNFADESAITGPMAVTRPMKMKIQDVLPKRKTPTTEADFVALMKARDRRARRDYDKVSNTLRIMQSKYS